MAALKRNGVTVVVPDAVAPDYESVGWSTLGAQVVLPDGPIPKRARRRKGASSAASAKAAAEALEADPDAAG